MPLLDKATIVRELSPPLDNLLATQLTDEFISAERRFIQRDWEPAELDGGQFCEICSRIYYHADSGILSQSKSLDDCLRYIENDNVDHFIQPRHDALHVAKVLRTVYKFRSQRGAVHISPNYTPNHMDAKLVVENVRWLMNETLRIFWNGDRDAVARAVRELLQFDVPSIGKFGGSIKIWRVNYCTKNRSLGRRGDPSSATLCWRGRFLAKRVRAICSACSIHCHPGVAALDLPINKTSHPIRPGHLQTYRPWVEAGKGPISVKAYLVSPD